ncbi:MAG: hypothetical protein GJ677_19165 [Rhodobacteraceae bacterium]|nr:hypothetical protein [Paracoccaceae bacterium]
MENSSQSHPAKTHAFAHIQPEAYCSLLHPQNSFGLPSVLVKNHDGNTSGKAVEVDHLVAMLPVYQDATSYLSLNRFHGSRGNSKVAALNALYVDLDFYNIDKLRRMSPSDVRADFLSHLSCKSVPAPNLFLNSGRGLSAIWLIDSLPSEARSRWKATMQALLTLCAPFGADKCCSDEARVFRLPGTLNEKSNTEVAALLGSAERQDFDALSDAVFNSVGRPTREEFNHRRRALKGSKTIKPDLKEMPVGLSPAARFALILSDLEAIRGHFGGRIPEGTRNTWLHLYATCLTHLHNVVDIEGQIAETARQATPDLPHQEVAAIQKQAKAKALHPDKRYYFRGSKIAAMLGVSDDLARDLGLKQVMSEQLRTAGRSKQRTANRRSKGVVARKDYLAVNSASQEKPWEALGISRATYYRRKKQNKLPRHSKGVRQVCLRLQGHHGDQETDPDFGEGRNIALCLSGTPLLEGARQANARSKKEIICKQDGRRVRELRDLDQLTRRSLEPARGAPGI